MIGFLGAGRVGAQAALEVASAGIDDVALVDIAPGLAEGEAMDISQKIAETGVDVDVRGSTDFSSLRGSTVVVITAGLARKPGMTRMDLLEKNAGIVAAVAKEVAKHAPGAVALTVTNPMDVMNYVVLRKTGFPKGRVVGMGGILDLSRFKSTISAMLDVSHSSISSLVIGEHGESMVPLPRLTLIGGVPLTKLMDETQIALAIETTRRKFASTNSRLACPVCCSPVTIAARDRLISTGGTLWSISICCRSCSTQHGHLSPSWISWNARTTPAEPAGVRSSYWCRW